MTDEDTDEPADRDEEESVDGPADPGERADVAASTGAWDAVVGDMESTAAAYEEAGWDVYQCHPGDVTVVTGEEDVEPELEGGVGIDVLLPDDEYERVEDLLEGGVEFVEYEVLTAEEGGVLYFVVVMEDPDAEVALLYPGYYEVASAEPLFERAREEGELRTYLRRLQGEYVRLVHEDPSLFEPEDGF